MRHVRFLGLVFAITTWAMAVTGSSGLQGKWQIETVKGVDNLDVSRTEFVLINDGSASMTVGCNRMRSQPKIEGNRIKFGSVATTRMACQPPVDLVESSFRAALDLIRAFDLDISGRRLMLLNNAGDALVTLRKAD